MALEFSNKSIFDDIGEMAKDAGVYAKRYRASLKWFRTTVLENVKGQGQRSLVKVLSDTSRMAQRIRPGEFYMFYYPVPKTADKLEYYDRFPFFLCVEKQEDRLFGINFHYYPPKFRTQLFLDLIRYRNTENVGEDTRLLISYKRIKNDPLLREADLGLRSYLTNRIRSRIIHIKGPEWPIALYLPFERFRKAGRQQVWAETRRDEAST